MTTFSNNPHTAYNGVVSGQRNMILGLLIFGLSIFIGMKATYEFQYYLDYYKGQLPEHIPVDSWYMWSYVAYTYTFILLFVAVMFFSSKIISRK